MKNSEIENNLISLFKEWANENVIKLSILPLSGSNRIYYRIFGNNRTALGVYNKDYSENLAFVKFTEHFEKYKLPVPEIYIADLNNNIYILQDLGDTTLFQFISGSNIKVAFSEKSIDYYKKIIELMPRFQVVAGQTFDYSYCYPRASFDKQSMMWDLNYFKYYFLKLSNISFDEQKLENDFQELTEFLLKADTNYFLYRDFQSRNIMLLNDSPYFIDYQGGRKGALQYDIASLLYDAKANIPQEIRNQLLDYYIDTLSKFKNVNVKEFKDYYFGYVIIRILQALGAYGFRGFYEKKEHFLLSIPYAIENLKWILSTVKLPIKIPHLLSSFEKIFESEELKKYGFKKSIENNLIVTVNSFSYKRGIPPDESGNGGGFVFDCRTVPNPGRLPEYQNLTGKDEQVIEFLKKTPETATFLNSVYELVDQSIEKYLERKFTHLMINFGCTGGQHRSVYCAEEVAKHIKEKFSINIKLRHIEQELKNLN
ncbi:MAG: phosphotransferase enzyme family protein [Bacteroidetes bacterium GWA2_30_7]|nr:MAG: phosphotransferase enzyme family protein [Bacteroidetes bacterium GWA2_30_7]